MKDILNKNIISKSCQNMTSISHNILHLCLLLFIFTISNSEAFGKSTFSSERIKQAVTSLVSERLSGNAEIDFLTNLKTIDFNEDDIAAEIILDDVVQPGMNVVGLKFSYNDRLLKYVEIQIRLKILTEVWVATRSIPSNTKLTERDFILKKKSLNNAGYPLDIQDLIGRELSRSISQDDFVTKDMLTSEVLVKRGDKVTIVVQSGGVRIRCSGTAVQDGASGQLVRVKRDGSPAVLSGKVAEDGSVIVYSNNYSQN